MRPAVQRAISRQIRPANEPYPQICMHRHSQTHLQTHSPTRSRTLHTHCTHTMNRPLLPFSLIADNAFLVTNNIPSYPHTLTSPFPYILIPLSPSRSLNYRPSLRPHPPCKHRNIAANKAFMVTHGISHEEVERAMRLLALCSLGAQQSVLSYEAIAVALKVLLVSPTAHLTFPIRDCCVVSDVANCD